MVQAEIFLQYSLQPKALERLQRIAEFFPGEERHNDRLRKLYQLANWWPEGTPEPRPTEDAAGPAVPATDSADTMRDLAKISEISRSLFRLPSARAILSTKTRPFSTVCNRRWLHILMSSCSFRLPTWTNRSAY